MKKIGMLILCIIALISTLTGCGNVTTENGRNLADADSGKDQTTNRDNHQTTENKVPKYDLEKIDTGVVKGSQDFAFDIFKQLNEEDLTNSIFISPFSISQALTMTYNGAEASTKDSMEKVLGFSGLDRLTVNESYQNLNDYLGQVDENIQLNIGNSLWIREGQKLREEFIRTNETNFHAKADTLDFSDPKAADTINGWIKHATKGKIDQMLETPIPDDIVLYLINAIYFKGEWSEQFDPKLTYQDDFTALDGNIQRVNMMRKKDSPVEYTGNEQYKAVRLPYGNKKISMYLLLPAEGTEINEFIRSFTPEQWEGLKKTVKEREDIVFRIPRFKLEYGIKNLNDSLTALGMEEAFERNADFSGIRENICISRVLHKAVIEVNEEGSEAAAATVVENKCAAAAEPLTFIANRPFLFIINDDVMDTILFMGKVVSIEDN